MTHQSEIKVKLVLDTEEAESRLAYLADLADQIPDMEYEELQEATLSWPWVMMVLAGAAGGLIVFIIFFLIAWLA